MFARYASVGASVLRKVCGSSEPVSRRMLEYGFFFAAGLILSMAVTSRPGGHPDEASHYPSAQYYASRFLPPHPADPANPRDPVYNFSRLSGGTPAYFVVGKLGHVLDAVLRWSVPAYRLPGLLFFVWLAWYVTGRDRRLFLLGLPLLMSPQIWYVFSYVNEDAFPLLCIYAATFQVAKRNSWLHRYLRAGGFARALPGAAVFALTTALVAISKEFYKVVALPVCVLLFVRGAADQWNAVLLRRHWSRRDWTVFAKCVLLVVFVGACYGGHRQLMRFVRGERNRPELSREEKERQAARREEAGEIAREAPVRAMREKGVPFGKMLPMWLKTTFESAFGRYDQLNIHASDRYYQAMWVLSGLLIVVCSAGICLRGSAMERVSLLVCAGSGFALLFGLSYIHSWQSDYQAQGRYLFPLLPLLGLVFHDASKSVSRLFIHSLVLLLFAMSAYSFVFIGLMHYT